jgi:hypothetical protein
METDVVSLSLSFWPYFFFLWLAYSLILIIIRILLQLGETMPTFFRYFGLFYNIASKQEMNNILFQEQLGNQVIFGFLIIEFLVIHYYLSLPNNIEVMSEAKIDCMVRMMDAKIKLYLWEDQDEQEEDEKTGPDQKVIIELKEEKRDKNDLSKFVSMYMLRMKYETELKEFEGETEEEKEEMSKFIRVKKKDKGEKTFRGIRFTGAPPRRTTMIKLQEYDMDARKSINVDENTPILGNLTNIEEFRNRQETAFKIDTDLVLNNLNLDFNQVQLDDQDNNYTTELPVMQLVSNMINAVNDQNDESDNDGVIDEPFDEHILSDQPKKPVHILIYLDQQATTQIKILYKERNSHIYNVARILNSFSYITGRLMILPLLYSLTEKTPTNLLFLFVTAAYVFKFNVGSFEDQMKFYLPIFSQVIFIETLYQFFSELPTTKNLFTYNSNASAPASPPTGIIIHSSFYRLWLIAIASIGFASIIWTAKFVFAHMFIIRQKISDIFYTYTIEDRKIEVDFSKWKHYQLIVSSLLVNGVYSQLNDIYITCLIVYLLVNSSKSLLLLLMIGMFGLNILMRMTKSYTTVVMEENAVAKLKLGLRVVVIVLFALEFILQILDILQLFKIPVSDKLRILKGEVVGSHIMVIVTLLFYDLLRANNYVIEKRKIVNHKELHTKFTDICEAQETNESKIYERVMIMMANDRLQSQIDRYLKKGIINSAADLNYYKTDIKQKLRLNRYTYLERYLDPWTLFRIKATEAFYVTLLKVCNPYVQQDMLYLFSKVCQIDSGIVDPSEFNLSDYLSCDYRVLDKIYSQIEIFYKNLLLKEEQEYKLYKSKMNHFEQHAEVNIEEDYEICGMQAEQQLQAGEGGLSGIRTFRPSMVARKKKNSTLQGIKQDKPRNSEEIQPLDTPLTPQVLVSVMSEQLRPSDELNTPDAASSALSRHSKKEKLSAAADILAKYILTKRSYQSGGQFIDARSGAKFKIPEEDCFLIFHNIKSDNMNSTQGLTKLRILDIIQILSCLFWSNLETIISLNIIVVLYFNGGVMSILIMGILFFRILIEEQGGRLMWWEILNIAFFVQFVFKMIANSLVHNRTNSSIDISFYEPWVIILGGHASPGTLRADAVVQISIMWLIHFINKKIINLSKGKNLVTTGVSIARVNLFDLVHYGRKNHESVHHRDQ